MGAGTQLPRPRIRVGGLSGDVYIVTHGREKDGVLTATRKYKANADFEAVAPRARLDTPRQGGAVSLMRVIRATPVGLLRPKGGSA